MQCEREHSKCINLNVGGVRMGPECWSRINVKAPCPLMYHNEMLNLKYEHCAGDSVSIPFECQLWHAGSSGVHG